MILIQEQRVFQWQLEQQQQEVENKQLTEQLEAELRKAEQQSSEELDQPSAESLHQPDLELERKAPRTSP